MSKILFLKGLPASGKSTYAKELVAKEGYSRVSKDYLRQMFHYGKWSGKNEKEVVAHERVLAGAILSHGGNVVVDDTNFNPEHESFFRQLAEHYDAKFEIKFFDTPFEECIKRDKERKDSVGAKVIEDMYYKYLYKKPERLKQDENLLKAIIVDLDGTLCNIDHRLHHLKNKDWDSFFAEIPNDTVNDWCEQIMHHIEYPVILCSGRPEKYRKVTMEWLDKHFIPYQLLLMRPDTLPDGKSDYRQDAIVKEEIFHKEIEGKYNIPFVIDDRKQVVDMWRRLGLTVLQCDDGNY